METFPGIKNHRPLVLEKLDPNVAKVEDSADPGRPGRSCSTLPLAFKKNVSCCPIYFNNELFDPNLWLGERPSIKSERGHVLNSD